jgi:hypothetical protein
VSVGRVGDVFAEGGVRLGDDELMGKRGREREGGKEREGKEGKKRRGRSAIEVGDERSKG